MMVVELLSVYWVYILLPIALGIGCFIGRRSVKRQADGGNLLNDEYVKGFNYLLNDQSDKAVEVFVKALEVDSETVELHLALGGLFRREGEVSRATRIHQNIIARPYLTDEQNTQAVFELAQDYLKAGLYDRAENLFLELVERKHYVENALAALVTIYESEKDWHKAIGVTKQLDSSGHADIKHRLSQYWCELAEIALVDSDFDQVKKCLRQSKANKANSIRRRIIEAEMLDKMGDTEQAIIGWRAVLQENGRGADLVMGKLCSALWRSSGVKAVQSFLLARLQQQFSNKAAELYLDAHGYKKQAFYDIFASFQSQPNRDALLWLLMNRQVFDDANIEYSVVEILSMFSKGFDQQSLVRNPYLCTVCGLQSKVINWQCPSCRTWDRQEYVA